MLPELELRKALISLSQNPRLKVQLILASPELPNAKEIPDGTKFRVNRAFALIKGGKVAPRGKVSLIGRLALTAEKNSRKDDEVKIKNFKLTKSQILNRIFKFFSRNFHDLKF